ncbi:MAG TPA: hypothetical protein VNP03_00470 [Pseudonocardia sp.]|nr:hypothetical protein [Pseudonocardia sp.]
MHSEQNDLGEAEANPLASVLSGMPEVWQRLLEEHVPDSYGRCLACRNSSTAGVPWPCTLQVAAADARSLSLGPGELSGELSDSARRIVC